jgi:hypothetical protein
MTATLAIRGMTGVEHAQADGSFAPYLPIDPLPPRIKPGDRIRVRLEVADDTWIYAIAVSGAEYRAFGGWAPAASGGVRMLWPGGRVLGADDALLDTLVVVASREELPWARDLTRMDCSHVVDQMPVEPPNSLCDHLYGLYWKTPRRPRGLVPHRVEFFEEGGARIPAIVAEHRGAPYTALEWQFKPRT